MGCIEAVAHDGGVGDDLLDADAGSDEMGLPVDYDEIVFPRHCINGSS